ncbi:MAG TPA: DUF1501 domain-containing protein [Pirellulales bacterium]|nr:DUF1501 domain-containing protein [Pirellulales bacterium]
MKFSRRNLIEIGFSSALGAAMTTWPQRAGAATEQVGVAGPPPPRAKSVLFLFLFGGPSHLDTFDPKPHAPDEVRGEFQTIATAISGLRICEHLPLFAQRMNRWALVRSMTCNPSFGDHRLAVHGLLGGIDELPAGAGLAASRRDWPSWCAGVEYARGGGDTFPASVMLPGEVVDPGTGLYPGQNGGLLGSQCDPYQVRDNPADPKYLVDASLRMPPGITIERLASKHALLVDLERQQTRLGAADAGSYDDRRREAFRVLTSGRLSQALDVAQEPQAVRDRYGRHMFGQSMLMARRLIEAGVPIVQANVSYQALWDTHYNNFVALRDLLPHLDRAVSNLTDDMQASGLLDETLIVMMGEFGRTPKLAMPNGSVPYFTSPGRDHWMTCFFGLFAGAGVRGGQVIGRSDAIGAHPVTRCYRHSDVAATVYSALGIDPAMEIHDALGRPLRLNSGQAIEALYTGHEA